MKLQEGDVIEIKKGMTVYTKVPYHLVYSNAVGNFAELTSNDTKVEKFFMYLAGKYIVTKTSMEGGGHGHGPNDVYPDGWRVYAQHTEHKHVQINFYQSGSFTAMIREDEIKAIGKATATWKIL